jgi:hypothetical protein
MPQMSKSEEKHPDWVRFATAKPCLSRVFSDAGSFSTAPLSLYYKRKPHNGLAASGLASQIRRTQSAKAAKNGDWERGIFPRACPQLFAAAKFTAY